MGSTSDGGIAKKGQMAGGDQGADLVPLPNSHGIQTFVREPLNCFRGTHAQTCWTLCGSAGLCVAVHGKPYQLVHSLQPTLIWTHCARAGCTIAQGNCCKRLWAARTLSESELARADSALQSWPSTTSNRRSGSIHGTITSLRCFAQSCGPPSLPPPLLTHCCNEQSQNARACKLGIPKP
eukprot:351352-Chlamydomonas_euryale.AAC.7